MTATTARVSDDPEPRRCPGTASPTAQVDTDPVRRQLVQALRASHRALQQCSWYMSPDSDALREANVAALTAAAATS